MLRRFLVLALILAVALPLLAADGAAVAKKKKKKKRADPDAGSRYKSYKVLTPEEGHTYFFNAQAEPITAEGKKKSKKAKRSSTDDAKPDCSQGDACSDAPSGD